MNLNQLYYFSVLAKYQHYTKASEELHIAQPTLSKAISSLEAELNVFLFKKQGRNVVLTKQGKQYYEYVKVALRELDKGNEYLRKEITGDGAQINLGFITSLSMDYIPELIHGFIEQEDKPTFFSLKENVSQELIRGLKNEEYDAVFCTPNHLEKDIEFMPIVRQRFVFACLPDHPFAKKTSITMEEAGHEKYVAHSPESAIHHILLNMYTEMNILPCIVSEANEDQAILSLVKAGVGCAIMTDSLNIRKFDGIAFVPIEHPYVRNVCMAVMKNQEKSEIVRRFIKYINSNTKKSIQHDHHV